MMPYNTCKQNRVFEKPMDQSIIPLLSNVCFGSQKPYKMQENVFKIGSLRNITMHGKDSWTVVLLGATGHCVCFVIV